MLLRTIRLRLNRVATPSHESLQLCCAAASGWDGDSLARHIGFWLKLLSCCRLRGLSAGTVRNTAFCPDGESMPECRFAYPCSPSLPMPVSASVHCALPAGSRLSSEQA